MITLPAFEPLAPHRFGDAARLLAAAFDDDPAYRYLFPDSSTRPSGLADFFRRNLETHRGHTFAARDDDGIVATVTLRPPGGLHVSTATMIRRGLLPFAVRHGARAVRRLFALKGAYDALERDAARGRPSWYVHMMVVDPRRQGRGVGSALLREVLRARTADDDGARHPIVLTTNQPRNVVFYRRLGFDVIDARDVRLAGWPPYRVWSMARPAARDAGGSA